MFWGYVTYVKKLNSIVYIFGLLFRYQVVIWYCSEAKYTLVLIKSSYFQSYKWLFIAKEEKEEEEE